MDKISLLLFNRISNIFYKKLSSIEVDSRINCEVIFKRTEAHLSKNCNINIRNKCLANEDISFRLLLESIQEALPLMNEIERKSIKEKLGITEETDIGNAIDNKTDVIPTVISTCKAYASVDNKIYIHDVEIQSCESSVPLYFEFVNSGSATANCGLLELSKSLVNYDKKKNEKQDRRLVKIFGIKVSDYLERLLPILLIFIIAYILIKCLMSFAKKYKIVFYSRNDIISKDLIDYKIGITGIRPNVLSYFK